jgi:hypothetical protein
MRATLSLMPNWRPFSSLLATLTVVIWKALTDCRNLTERRAYDLLQERWIPTEGKHPRHLEE